MVNQLPTGSHGDHSGAMVISQVTFSLPISEVTLIKHTQGTRDFNLGILIHGAILKALKFTHAHTASLGQPCSALYNVSFFIKYLLM